MATYKIRIYERMARLTSDAAICELPDNFGESDVMDAAIELLSGSVYGNSDALDAIDQAADGGFEMYAVSDGWQDEIFRVDVFTCAEQASDEGETELLATIEIERI